jgi:hypothetical protein
VFVANKREARPVNTEPGKPLASLAAASRGKMTISNLGDFVPPPFKSGATEAR